MENKNVCEHCGSVIGKIERIQLYIKQHKLDIPGDVVIGESDDRTTHSKAVKIPLPNCNTRWTYEVWDWVREFCKEFPFCYPTHYEDDDTSKFQYIHITE